MSAVLDVPFHLIMAFSLAVSAAGEEASRDANSLDVTAAVGGRTPNGGPVNGGRSWTASVDAAH